MVSQANINALGRRSLSCLIYHGTKDSESTRLSIRQDYPSLFPFGLIETPQNRVKSYLAEEYGHEEEI